MSVWSKIITALQGGANKVAESVADSHILTTLDQKINDADEDLKQAKHSLAEMMAKQKVAKHKELSLINMITEFEDYAVEALEKNDDFLALDLADKIANLEKQQNKEQNTSADYMHHIDHLRQAIKLADDNINHLKQEIETVQANEDIQKVQAIISHQNNTSNSNLSSLKDSLERIKEKQVLKNDQFDAEQELAEDLSSDKLNQKLKEAGVISPDFNAESVLARLKSKVVK